MKRNSLKTLRPGILIASTAIGVSHLVQSTRAGANYGFMLLWAVILVNIMKYPFFEYGSRYANSRGESIIDGYKRIGNWMLWLYFIITVASMFFVSAAVGAVTAGFLDNLFGISNLISYPLFTPILLFAVCIGILLFGNYKALDGLIKIIGTVLVISTLIAFTIALVNGPVERSADFIKPEVWNDKGILFMIALMGWMPTAVDMSTWNSLWTIERIKQTGYKPKLKETLLDFNIGYLASALLAICFITLGAYLVYGTGIEMPSSGAKFANKVVELYTLTIGSWSKIIIGAAAFSIMFGTSIAVFDGYSRSLERCVELTVSKRETIEIKHAYKFSLLIVGVGSFVIIAFFSQSIKVLVDLATTISFLISPIIAIVNFRLVSRKYIDQEAVPPLWLKILSYLGLIFLTGFSIFFIYTQIISFINA